MKLLVGVETSWGSFEWILPVCKYLKDRHHAEIVFLILRKSRDEIFRGNIEIERFVDHISSNQCFDLFDVLPKWTKLISNLIRYLLTNFIYRWTSEPYNDHNRVSVYWFNFCKKYFFKQSVKVWIDRLRPDICLSDNYSETELFAALKKRDIRIGYYLDASSLLFCLDIFADYEPVKKKYRYPGFLSYDFYLSDNIWRAEFIKKVTKKEGVFFVGSPKFDSWWVNYLIEDSYGYKERLLKNDDKNVILVLLKNEYSIYSDLNDFQKLLKDIISVCLKGNAAHVIIKPHPRQDLQLLSKILNQYSREHLTVSEESAISLICKSNVVIAMPSSVIFTALIMERPVIEYLDFNRINRILKRENKTISKGSIYGWDKSLTDSGELTSIYRKLKLAHGANNLKELETWIERYNMGNLPSYGTENLREIFPDGASKKIADIILSNIEDSKYRSCYGNT